MNQRWERALKTHFLELTQQQNVHKTSQISTTSVHSAKINLPKETDYDIWVSNEEQDILEQLSQKRGEQTNGSQDQRALHFEAKLLIRNTCYTARISLTKILKKNCYLVKLLALNGSPH